MGRNDVLAFWFGEPDEVTPAFIRQAGVDALDAGETFYTHNLGIAELREAIATYVSRLHRPTGVDAIAVTNSGMSALMLVDAGAGRSAGTASSRSRRCGPTWWRFRRSSVRTSNASSCDSAATGGRSTSTACLPRSRPDTRAVYINSPNNPTGWTLDADEQRAILAHCRRHGIWIVADDAYERLYFAGGARERWRRRSSICR